VAPLFHYVEKGDKNDGDVSCSVTATLFFCLVKQETKFCGKNFTTFRKIAFISRNEISQSKHKNFAKYERNLSRNFVSRNFIDHPNCKVPLMADVGIFEM
jgi:hypothetical protein